VQRLAVNGQTVHHDEPFATRNAAPCGKEEQGEQVANYRIYCLDGVNKVAAAKWIEADDHEAAIELVKQQHEGYKCEIWDGPRLIARVDLRREA
jgi:hypothetical protein